MTVDAKENIAGNEEQMKNQWSWLQFYKHPYFTFALRVVIGLMLVRSGFLKLIDMEGMAKAIDNYQILPSVYVNLPAIIIPAIEFVMGACLVLGLFMDGTLAILSGLFIVFIIAIESAILRGLDIECGCSFTSDAERVGIKILLQDTVLLLVMISIWLTKKPILQLDNLRLR